MKKHRKLVALLIALTFLFSVAAPAMAASDVSAAEKAAGKLEALGIIEGYPDGTFGLDREITRAEFAKVAVIASGHGDAGEILKATPSKFSDVKTNEWYTGWINLAASQGYVKGYPDGTFRPNDKITNAEVVTVLLRLLGYNDNLPGDWPTNYIVKAVALEITKGISFDAKGFAVRGEVFMMADKTLDTEMVKWVSDDQAFEGKDEKLIAKSFEGEMEDGLVRDVKWDSKGNISLNIDGVKIKATKNVIVAGAPSAVALLGSKVDYIVNDDDELVFVGTRSTDTVVDTELTVGTKTLEIDDSKYDLAKDFDITFYPVAVAAVDGKYEADEITVVLNKDGDAQWAFVSNYTGAAVIDEIDGRYLELNDGSKEVDEDDNYVIIKDGAVADFDALAEGDLIYVYNKFRGLDYIIIASSDTVNGNFEKANAAWTKLTVDGTAYNAAKEGVLVSDDGGDEYDLGAFNKDMFGNDVILVLSPAGKVAAAISDIEAAKDSYGVLVSEGESRFEKIAKVLTSEGKNVTYAVVDNDNTGAIIEENEGRLIKYKLNSDGEIKSAALVGVSYTVAKTSTNRIKLGSDDSDWHYLTSDATFFCKDNSSSPKWVTTSWDTFKGGVEGQQVTVVLDKNRVAYVLFNGTIADTGNVAIVMASGNDSKGFFYTLNLEGDTVTYYTYNDKPFKAGGKNIGPKALVEFDLSDKEITGMNKVSSGSYVEQQGKVESVGSGYIKVEGDYYDISDDTVIVDITDTNPKVATRISRGNYVDIHNSYYEKGYVKYILIVKGPDVDGDEDEDEVTGLTVKGVTVAGEGYHSIRVESEDGTATTYEVSRNVIVEGIEGGFTTSLIGKVVDIEVGQTTGLVVYIGVK